MQYWNSVFSRKPITHNPDSPLGNPPSTESQNQNPARNLQAGFFYARLLLMLCIDWRFANEIKGQLVEPG